MARCFFLLSLSLCLSLCLSLLLPPAVRLTAVRRICFRCRSLPATCMRTQSSRSPRPLPQLAPGLLSHAAQDKAWQATSQPRVRDHCRNQMVKLVYPSFFFSFSFCAFISFRVSLSLHQLAQASKLETRRQLWTHSCRRGVVTLLLSSKKVCRSMGNLTL